MVKTEIITLNSKGNTELIDITNHVQSIVKKSEVLEGNVSVYVVGSTCSITTIEYEQGLKADFKDAMERIAPKNITYEHDNAWHDGNGHSHIRASIIGSSKTFPVLDGEVMLGTWQQIVFIDFDNKKRSRRIVVQVIE
ncbi:secondary thiamine-phosphate synthase enzyme YjbQ [bacterium]